MTRGRGRGAKAGVSVDLSLAAGDAGVHAGGRAVTRDGVEADAEAGLCLSVQVTSVTRRARGEAGVHVCHHPVQSQAWVMERPPGHVDTTGPAVLQHLDSLVIRCQIHKLRDPSSLVKCHSMALAKYFISCVIIFE